MPDVSSLSAVQPRVLVAWIQCATMATEVVEVATESEKDVIINWGQSSLKKERKGRISGKKNKFCCNVNSLRDKKVIIPEETFIPHSTTSTGSSKLISHLTQDVQDQ